MPVNKQVAIHEKHRDFPNFWLALLIIGVLMGVQMLIAAAFHDAGARYRAGDPAASVITVLGFGVIMSALMSYKNLRYGELFNSSGLSISALLSPLVIPVFVTSFGSIILATEANNLLLHRFPLSEAEFEAYVRLFSGGVVSVIALCVIAPFVEEMLFRGIFLRSFFRSYTPTNAILLSALVFGLAHLNVYQFVVATTLGLVSGWLYYVTRSLWPTILEHAVYNGGVYVYVHSFPETLQSTRAGPVPIHSAPVLSAAVIAFVCGLWWIFKVTPRALNTAP